MVDYYMEICRWMGLECPADARLRLFIGVDLQRRGKRLLARYGIGEDDLLIGLNPGASFGASKCWPPDYFAELAELCQERFGAKIIIFSGPGEEEIVETIVSLTAADIIDTRPDKVDLEMLKPLVARCNLMITNDTGPRHYAVAFDVPVVVIMGPTDPRYTDSNTERTVVVRRELPCSPCHLKTCPGDHACMKLIEPPEVLAAAEKLCKICA
jgi:heptosyltransferase-2